MIAKSITTSVFTYGAQFYGQFLAKELNLKMSQYNGIPKILSRHFLKTPMATIFMTIPSQSELRESQYIGIPVILLILTCLRNFYGYHIPTYMTTCMISSKLPQVYLTTLINLTAS